MVTAKQIHSDFYKSSVGVLTDAHLDALLVTGFKIMPPKEYVAAFPINKIINMNNVIKLCEKYELEYVDTSRYIGSIPIKNLDELASFTSKYCQEKRVEHYYSGVITSHYLSNHKTQNTKPFRFNWKIVSPNSMISNVNHNNMLAVIISDPIIIAEIRGTEWGVIVTAWGDEASDKMVVNEKMN